jgi:hypothetical protein
MLTTAFSIFVALGLSAFAQTASSPSQNLIRYHHGDNFAWADAQFDDSAWPEAQNGSFTAPAHVADGFFWVRAQIAIPPGAQDPLAIESQTIEAVPNVQEVWVNGHLIGRYGDFPPHARPLVPPQMLVFDIPAGEARPGTVAIVALRTWNVPADRSLRLVRSHPDPVNVQFSIGSAPLLHALATEAEDRAWLRFWPQFSIALLFIMLGLAVLALGIWTRDRRLLLCALWLVLMPAYLVFGSLLSLLVGVSAPILYTAFLVVNAIGMCVAVEFNWTVQGFRDRIFRSADHLSWIGLTIGAVFSTNWMHPGALVSAGMYTEVWLLFVFNLITSGAELVALTGRGRNRPIAAAMLLISVGYVLRIVGNPVNFDWLGLNFFGAAFYLSTLFIAVLLMRQTWMTWRKSEDLRVEFAAARGLQQQLVPIALPAIGGWHMEAAYEPAADVGGDFYQIFEQPGGSALIVVGDVSGKGLTAAMKGVLALGAVRALAESCPTPACLLNGLNHEMVKAADGGFITCICAQIFTDGRTILSSAGHPAPYLNGEELQIGGGIPLGILSNTEYSETSVQLRAGQSLMFLSDGVLEATNSAGELFGFDRTAAIARHDAYQIAHAAKQFGQEDDITVLTLAFVPTTG